MLLIDLLALDIYDEIPDNEDYNLVYFDRKARMKNFLRAHIDKPLKVTGVVQKSVSLTEAFVSAVTAIAKAFSPSQAATETQEVPFSSKQKLDLRMKTLEQLRQLQKLFEDGILSQEEFDS